MAAGRLPAPGTEYGPCEPVCEHTDCKATRLMAESICTYCKKEIGYETRFYREDDGQLVHAICLEESIEKEKGE